MISDSLIPVFLALYLLECIFPFRETSIIFYRRFSRRWRARLPDGLYKGAGRVLYFVNPFPPLGNGLVAPEWPFAADEVSVSAALPFYLNPGKKIYRRDTTVNFADIKSLERDGKKIKINSRLFLELETPVFADLIFRLLEKMKTATEGERSQIFDAAFRRYLFPGHLKRLLQLHGKVLRLPRLLANMYFVLLFLGVLPAVWVFNLSQTWPLVLALILGFNVMIALLYFRLHKRLYPGEGEGRWSNAFTMLLSPFATLRIVDYLERGLFSVHPLALARELVGPEDFRILAEGFLRDTRFPVQKGVTALSPTVERYKRLMSENLDLFLDKSGLGRELLLQPPAGVEGSYCPRCLCEYRLDVQLCADCGTKLLIAH